MERLFTRLHLLRLETGEGMAERVRGRLDLRQCRGELAAIEPRPERAIGKQANPVGEHGRRRRPMHPGPIGARDHGLENGSTILDADAACLILAGGLTRGRPLLGRRGGALLPCGRDILLGFCRRWLLLRRRRLCRGDARSGLRIALGGLHGAPGEPEHSRPAANRLRSRRTDLATTPSLPDPSRHDGRELSAAACRQQGGSAATIRGERLIARLVRRQQIRRDGG